MMKKINVALLVLLIGLCAQAEDPPVKVFIFAGQSNLPKDINGTDLPAGLATWINTSPENDSLYFHDGAPGGLSTDWAPLYGHGDTSNKFGAEHVFAYYLTSYFKSIDPNQRLAFIQVQYSSTSLFSGWNPGGRVDRVSGTSPANEKSTHVHFRTTVTNSLGLLSRSVGEGGQGLTYEVAGLIWNQGEGDMFLDDGSQGYATRFRDLIGEWVDDPVYSLDNVSLYTGGPRGGFIDPSSGSQSVAQPGMFVLTTRLPLLQAENKAKGDDPVNYDGPIGTLRVRDSLTDGNEAGENIQGLSLTSSNAWWVGCDEFATIDPYHLEQEDRGKVSRKYAGVYLSEILGLGLDAVDFWPSMLTSEDFERAGVDPYTNSPTYNQKLPFAFGSAPVANAHTRRYPVQNAFGYPLNTQATKVWWTGTDQRWSKTNPTDRFTTHEAVFNGTEPGRLVQVICDSHWAKKALKISFDAKSLDLDGSPNGLSISLYGATTEGMLDYTDPNQPAGQYLPADFSVALDAAESNQNVELLASLTVLDPASGQPNELTDWTNITLNAEIVDTEGYSYFVLVFEGDNVQTSSGDFLGVDNVEVIPAEKSAPQISLSTTMLSVPEGSTNTFSVKLNLSPTNAVPMTVNVARASGDTNITVSSSNSLVFTTNTWDSWQSVTLSAAQDDDYTNGTAVIQCTGEGLLLRNINITEIDDEPNPNYALPWSEPFETLSQGTLDGQHGWVAEAGAIVTTSDAQGGLQALSLAATSASHTFLGAPANIWIEFWSKPVRGVMPGQITGSVSAVFYVNTNDQIVAYSNTTAITLDTTVSNGWNKFGVECDYVSKVWKIELNDVLVASNLNFYGSPASFSAFELQSTASSPAWLDEINITDSLDGDDTDGDGLPDTWETIYFGDVSPDPLDLASNGVNTVLGCYIAGIDPTDANARFEMTDFTSIGADSVIHWSGVSGRVYTVYWTSNLLDTFSVLQSEVPWTGTSFTDATHAAENEGFYKIEVEVQ